MSESGALGQWEAGRHSPRLENCHLFVFGLYRNPPADHWALVSGLPTYVAQNGLVSDTTWKGEESE